VPISMGIKGSLWDKFLCSISRYWAIGDRGLSDGNSPGVLFCATNLAKDHDDREKFTAARKMPPARAPPPKCNAFPSLYSNIGLCEESGSSNMFGIIGKAQQGDKYGAEATKLDWLLLLSKNSSLALCMVDRNYCPILLFRK